MRSAPALEAAGPRSRECALTQAATRASAIDVDLSARSERLPGGLVVAVLPFVLLMGLGLWALPHVDRLPGRLAVHWGFNGPERWVTTSPCAIVTLLVQHAFMCLALTAAALGVLHWSRRISASGPAAAAERQFRRRAVLLILTTEYFTILPPAFTLLQAPAFAMQIWGAVLPAT